MGQGDDYQPSREYHIILRRWIDRDEQDLAKPALALHIQIMPQYLDLVYKSGDQLQCPHGEGTRLLCWTTWAENPLEIERRMYDALRAIYGAEAFDLADRVEESRRIPKAEAHIRFHRDKKNAAVETLEQSKHLIAWGGGSEIDARQQRQKHGWLEAVVDSNRWNLLGFDSQRYSTELKIYHIEDWHERPASDPFAHPKLEASYSGIDSGALPHIDEWEEVLDHLKSVVATHARWAGIERSDLIKDDFFDGPFAPAWEFQRPTGRREMLRQRYKDASTEIYREALKESTTAVYDILKVIAEESGASYDLLEQRTGLARSTIRYHVKRLAEHDVVKRIGNPVIVVYFSHNLLDRALEILREVRPDEMPEDMVQRAQERRVNREKSEKSEPKPSTESTNEIAESDDNRKIGFQYLDNLDGTIEDIAEEYNQDRLSDRDIRVRADELPDDLY